MHIAIVDDDPTLRITLRHFLHKWHTEKNLPLEMLEFNNGDDFLVSCETNEYDIVFMDIFMDKKDGIETASEMRAIHKETILIFLTSSADHMPDAFSVHAYGYLIKPLIPEKLYKILDDVQSILHKDEPTIEITLGKVDVTLKYSDILYINSDSNYCIIHCPDPCKSRGPFSVLCEPLLDSPDFCVINRGIIVNLSHVKEMDTTDCIMDNGDILPLNTKKASAIRTQFTSYKFGTR